MVFDSGGSLSHSHKEYNNAKTGFYYSTGNVIRLTTNGDELWFENETRKTEFKMEVKLTTDEWKQARFFVRFYSYQSAVSISK